jgi:hydroxymethylpyrimidine/phosphomethylpyrimidine kinase
VLQSSSGTALLDESGLQVLRKQFLPLADLITPNLDEAAVLGGIEAGPSQAPWAEVLPWLRMAAAKLRSLGSRAVVITGGHLPEANDYLSYVEDGAVREEIFLGTHIESRSTHGTGCAFATSIACQLALGQQIPQAVRIAKEYVRKAVAAAYPLGKGIGPVNHLV